jgi:predicted  nucleic acid-binding Zn-ribbon protein
MTFGVKSCLKCGGLCQCAQTSNDPSHLQVELDAAFKTIKKLMKDLSDAHQKIQHLEDMLKRAPLPVIQKPKTIVQPVTVEAEIADMQLDRLREAARQRTLTLEETRMYDLLVKNKRLSQDESTVNLAKSGYRDVEDIELLKIVGPADLPDHNGSEDE